MRKSTTASLEQGMPNWACGRGVITATPQGFHNRAVVPALYCLPVVKTKVNEEIGHCVMKFGVKNNQCTGNVLSFLSLKKLLTGIQFMCQTQKFVWIRNGAVMLNVSLHELMLSISWVQLSKITSPLCNRAIIMRWQNLKWRPISQRLTGLK